jgi:hypothetical protein
MARKTSGHPIGGGPGSKNIVNKPVITGKSAYGVGPGWASQLGSAIGDHVTDGGRVPYKGEAMRNKLTPAGGAVPLGNQLATNVGKGGPGAGRTIHHCGSQSNPGPTRSPNATGRDTLAEFGPDTSNARNRR